MKCSSIKYKPGDPRYEIDLFDHVFVKLEALVVSLDSTLESIKRVWVVAEIGKAMQVGTVLFRLCNGLAREAIEKLGAHKELMPSVAMPRLQSLNQDGVGAEATAAEEAVQSATATQRHGT